MRRKQTGIKKILDMIFAFIVRKSSFGMGIACCRDRAFARKTRARSVVRKYPLPAIGGCRADRSALRRVVFAELGCDLPALFFTTTRSARDSRGNGRGLQQRADISVPGAIDGDAGIAQRATHWSSGPRGSHCARGAVCTLECIRIAAAGIDCARGDRVAFAAG